MAKTSDIKISDAAIVTREKIYNECCTLENFDGDGAVFIIQTALNAAAAEGRRLALEEGERLAPVQGYSAGIPWSMHLRAYAAYCKTCGPQPALIQGNCRGGFCTAELDDFVPGWRDELSEITKLKNKIIELSALANTPASSPWQPIATAPKDGTRILLATKYDGVILAEWAKYKMSADKFAWCGCEDRHLDEYKRDTFDATHWMPLPSAPNKPAGGEG